MFCPKCGKDVGNAAFCSNCGTNVGVANKVPAAPNPAPVMPNPAPAMPNPVPSGSMTGIQVNNLKGNDNILLTESLGCFEVYEYQRDISVNPAQASVAYFMHEMNFRKRQVLCTLNGNAVKLQAGAMQWMAGRVTMQSNIKGAKDFFGKAFKSLGTGESIAKPLYQGAGYVMLEPTYKYILLEDISKWGSGIVLDDGMFLACDASLHEEVVARSNASSALLGGEGLFNLSLSGNGIAVLESSVPRDELIEIVLNNDEVRIDGNMAVAWSKSLEFTVEKSTKSFLGSLASGEGLVNVYRGTGRILMAPVAPGTMMKTNNQPSEAGKTSSAGVVGSIASSLLDL